ncbi:gamma-glutamyl-gamma-aminobutyrate hydrolase family protein [uncultured Cohaesibacter sp.]|uniref:glutamine amidotransferase-related protein n=1 Tax=uncultured Cohaesibacter sp. TaxID=1002546 RepID=UPI00292E3D0D|nr:gamma-glutamyl-gamma-aminobutyrate hydrolase family protein [uncultured Cohaesibacter sp.]
MKIGILVAGPLPDELIKQFGTFDDMFKALLAKQDPKLDFASYQVFEQQFPENEYECDGWIVTGSLHSAYEQLDWMLRLEELIRKAIENDRPIIGICFGHQIMATAMGGRVEKAPSGKWGAAVHNYALVIDPKERPEWMDGTADHFSLQASHQDQVTRLPDGACLLGGNDFCPNGFIAYGTSGMSMQLHPELSSGIITTMLHKRRGEQMSEEDADFAISHANDPVDADMVGQWMVNFFRQGANAS